MYKKLFLSCIAMALSVASIASQAATAVTINYVPLKAR